MAAVCSAVASINARFLSACAQHQEIHSVTRLGSSREHVCCGSPVPNPLRCICWLLVPCFRLKSELAVFDRGFFEEVEDLKYSYATLKREAGRLAANQVGFLTHENVAAKLESDCPVLFGIVHTSVR